MNAGSPFYSQQNLLPSTAGEAKPQLRPDPCSLAPWPGCHYYKYPASPQLFNEISAWLTVVATPPTATPTNAADRNQIGSPARSLILRLGNISVQIRTSPHFQRSSHYRSALSSIQLATAFRAASASSRNLDLPRQRLAGFAFGLSPISTNLLSSLRQHRTTDDNLVSVCEGHIRLLLSCLRYRLHHSIARPTPPPASIDFAVPTRSRSLPGLTVAAVEEHILTCAVCQSTHISTRVYHSNTNL
jgi:hypothetical protein